MGTGIAVCPSSLCERLALPGCGRYRTCELQSVPLLFYSDIFIPWLENDNLHHWAIPDFAGFIAYQGKAGGSDMDEERNFKYSVWEPTGRQDT